VAVEFLTDEQAAGHGRLAGEPSQAELERYFFLDDTDRDLVAAARPALAAGFAVLLGTVRFLGTFLSPDPLDVPRNVVDYRTGQLGITDPSVVKRYTDRQMTAYEHARETRRACGYRDFADGPRFLVPVAIIRAAVRRLSGCRRGGCPAVPAR